MIAALIIIAVGIVLTGDLCYAWQISPFVLRMLGPAVLAVGIATFFHEALPDYGRIVGALTFFLGVTMLVLGIFPWAYTPLIIEDGGMEGSGMLGTLIFIMAMPPGLALTVLGKRWSR